MKNRKEYIILATVLLALVLIFVIFKLTRNNKVEEQPIVEAVPVTTAPVEQTKSVKPQRAAIIKKEKVATILPELLYADEFSKYRNGRLIQFSKNCEAFPTSMAIANGSTIMIDNRSNVEEVITVAGNKYTLTPYDFEVLTINAPQTPVTYLLDCNDRQNISTLIIE